MTEKVGIDGILKGSQFQYVSTLLFGKPRFLGFRVEGKRPPLDINLFLRTGCDGGLVYRGDFSGDIRNRYRYDPANAKTAAQVSA